MENQYSLHTGTAPNNVVTPEALLSKMDEVIKSSVESKTALENAINTKIDKIEGDVQKLNTAYMYSETKGKSDDFKISLKSRLDSVRRLENLKTQETSESYVKKFMSENTDIVKQTNEALAELSDQYYHNSDKVTEKALNGTVLPEGGLMLEGPQLLPNVRRVFSISPMRQISRVTAIDRREGMVITRDSLLTAQVLHENEGALDAQNYIMRGKRIGTNRYWSRLDATKDLMEDTNIDLMSLISEVTTEAIAYLQSAHFVYGDGLEKPVGILAPAYTEYAYDVNDGFNSSKGAPEAYQPGKLGYVKSGDPVNLSVDALIELVEGSLAEKFIPRAVLMMHSATYTKLLMQKDSLGNYLLNRNSFFQEGKRERNLLGYRVVINNWMPLPVPGSFPIAFGDFEAGYQIVDRLGMEFMSFVPTVSTANLRSFAMTMRTGGDVTDYQAFRLVKMEA